MTDEVREKHIGKFLNLLKDEIIEEFLPVSDVFCEENGENRRFDMSSDRWGKNGDSHAVFTVKFEIPEKFKNKTLRLFIDTSLDGWNVYNPQFECKIDGKTVEGLDTNHRFIELPYRKNYEIKVYGYTGSMGKNLDFRSKIGVINDKAEKLYYDLSVAFESLSVMERESKSYADLVYICEEIIRNIEISRKNINYEYIDEYVEKNLYGNFEKPIVTITGHTHIDVAWLWTLDRTREKARHTFSTVLSLMDKFPDANFFSSQPQLLKFIKQDDSELFERIKQKNAEGRFEFEGSMWVEADCNLTSGESLVRQIIHGKKFFRDEFGAENKILWLPDVFGYAASLPQICKKSGIDTFVTSKISWNDTNRMPHDIFEWVGIDGTKIFTYFLTAQDIERGKETNNYTTYVATSDPKCVIGTYRRLTDKHLSDKALLTMGWGDGGGGPTDKMWQKAIRLKKGVEGVPRVEIGKVSDFIDYVKKSAYSKGNIPKWEGELYLEYHRGTYTSAARNKKRNRKNEFGLANAEIYSVMAEILKNAKYPAEKLYSSWETLLLNQFHDIIPGSSIKKVYEKSATQYDEIEKTVADTVANSVNSLAEGTKNAVFNPNMTNVGGILKNGNEYVYVQKLPSVGFAPFDGGKNKNSIKSSEKNLESRNYILKFGENMEILSLFDKQNNTFVISKKKEIFTVYEDIPFNYDCWNLEEYHIDKSYKVNNVKSVEYVEYGNAAGYEITFLLGKSVIKCDVLLFEDSRRIDFNVKAEWNEKNLILKAEFDTEINNDSGVFDIQYGYARRNAHRNTSWDEAKFEVCGQKYAIIEDGGMGLALINDSKYGYSVKRAGISLSLLKASEYPNDFVDLGHHEFSFAILPYIGSFISANVIGEAVLFNNPPVIMGKTEKEYNLVSCDSKNILLSAAKKAYDENGYVFRFVEDENKKTNAVFRFGFDFEKAYICDTEENIVSEINKKNDNSLDICFGQFEIITIKLK